VASFGRRLPTRLLAYVTEIIDASRFQATVNGQHYEARALPGTSGLSVGQTVMAHVLPSSTELIYVSAAAADTYVILGIKYTGGPSPAPVYANVQMAYTPDITSAQWTAVANHPPAIISSPGGFQLILTESNRGYFHGSYINGLVTNTEHSGPNIWRNDNLKTGTWTKIMDQATFAAVTGWTPPGSGYITFQLTRLHAVSEAPGLLLIGIDAPNGVSYILHSHDYGVTWFSYHQTGHYFYSYIGPVVIISKADPDVMFTNLYNDGDSIEIWRSDDRGHTWARVDDTSLGWNSINWLSANWTDVNKVYTHNNEFWKSADKGISWNLINATSLYELFHVIPNGSKIIARGITGNFLLSTDEAVSFSSKTVGAQHLCVVRNGLYAFTRLYTDGTNTVKTIDDGLNETDVTGNIHAVLTDAGANHGLAIRTAGVPYP